jgi:endonuclease/exonuclease/phosphatase family metal-dependent hydrolase
VSVLLSWNAAGRVGANQERQIAALAAAAPPFDVLCLQEVTPTTRRRWEEALADLGLHVAVSDWPVEPRGSRRLAVLIASRAPVAPLPALDVPWPERHLAVRTLVDGVETEVHTLHAPLSSKEGQVKVRTLEALFSTLMAADGAPRIVCGDFNTPRYESREGEIVTFAQDRRGRLIAALGERHDRAERLLVSDLVAHGWRDVFRALHGYERRDRSWAMRNGFGYRLDHVVVSPELEPVASDYVHAWRTDRLSDHSALWVELKALPPA